MVLAGEPFDKEAAFDTLPPAPGNLGRALKAG